MKQSSAISGGLDLRSIGHTTARRRLAGRTRHRRRAAHRVRQRQRHDQLVWYINPDTGGQAEVAENCSTDQYTITTQVLPQDASQQRIQLARRLAAEDSGIDLMSIDPPFTAEFANAGFLAPIPPDLQDKLKQQSFKGAIDAATWDGQAGRGAVLVQHPGALVPQVLRREGRHRHDQAGDLGPDHQRRRGQRRHGRPSRPTSTRATSSGSTR